MMTTEMDALPESVREAIQRTNVTVEMFDTLVTVNRDDWDAIRAELLRLTARVQELERLEESALRALYRWIPRIRDDESPEMKSAYDDAAMLLRAPNCDDEPEHGEAILLRAERAESELAAIRKRIAEADSGLVTQLVTHFGSETYDTVMVEAYRAPFNSLAIGKRVALLPLDDEAKS